MKVGKKMLLNGIERSRKGKVPLLYFIRMTTTQFTRFQLPAKDLATPPPPIPVFPPFDRSPAYDITPLPLTSKPSVTSPC